MAGIFRFSNAVSDISKFIDTYKSLYNNFISLSEAGTYFGHDDAAQFLAIQGLASSLGAIGEEALRRSTRPDKSRDPLYNQHKSYSEIFRMLGWYEPGSMQTNFKLAEFGEYIFDANGSDLKKLFELNTLHIVSPNPLTNVKGYNILRPFPLILKLMDRLDGIICRDEIIIGVLACENDRSPDVLDATVEKIISIRRGGITALNYEMQSLREKNNITSLETLSNYTRFPISALKWNNWALGVSIKGIYGKRAYTMLQLSEKGRDLVSTLQRSIDLRYEDIKEYSLDSQAAFVVWSNLYHLASIEYNISGYQEAIPSLKEIANEIFVNFGINENENFILFFGYQEAPRDLLIKGDEILHGLI